MREKIIERDLVIALQRYKTEIDSPGTSEDRFDEIASSIRSTRVSLEIALSAIGIILDEKNRKLMLKKSPDDRGSSPNKFCFPGGGNKAGETLEETCKREVFEETGIDSRIVRKIGVRRYAEPEKGTIFVVHCYLLERVTSTIDIQLSSEHTEFGFFESDATIELAMPPTKELLQRTF